ncbi:Pre-mRNA-splicing factor Cwf15/Cwc15 [Annulohypoxylon truncatum]|uniref:Pre-mRNA-splicing factor Cwf15/Cwc15 n=1 Tax=Annulohypoxylon truncatum TaxID=327061 RepID=UPI0020081F44|nr:Pre-mRNA-splicing factor Cwf15/Cwc15 [Annulohypoxylon truncatum]KAI1213056.1 Pre-mRNA-splicing factor Cwf15/Cwc15 [Annulohypoxylon truncatum]
MTTAHRPTFDPARGKEALRGPAYHQRLLPAHTKLKFRQPGQGGDADEPRDLRAELLAAEAAHFAKQGKLADIPDVDNSESTTNPGTKRPLPIASQADDDEGGEDPEAKRQRVLAETRDIDEESEVDDSDEDSDEEDEEAELLRELERVRQERAQKREEEERAKAAAEAEEREREIALGNPLMNPTSFNTKRRWDDDVVFKNQARGTEDKNKKKEFINDMLRSDFHKRFMNKYVR